jgi:PTS system beta-glucosides-specific IIC component
VIGPHPVAARAQAPEEAREDSGSERRGFGETMKAIFLPMLPALIGAGILQGITSILVALGLLQEGSSFHTVLSTVSSAIFYFLPFLIAASSAKAFGTSPYLAIAVVAFFLAPEVVQVMEGDREITLFGIPVVKTAYTSSVIPIILMTWGMAFVHRAATRVTPDILKTVLVPPVTIAVTCVMGLLVLGPVGALLTRAITSTVTTLDAHASWVVPLLVGTLGALMVSVGLSFALFPIALESLLARGFDEVYGPGMLASNMALAGMALAVALRAGNSAYRAFSFTASATALLGVAQPALYGNALPLRRPFFAVMAGGASGGLVAGLTGFKVFGLMPAGLAAIPVYVHGSGWGNLLLAGAVMLTAFLVSFAGTWFLGYEQPDQTTVDEVTGANQG